MAAAAVQEIIGTELGYRALRAARGRNPSPRTARGRSDGHTCAQATLLFDSMLALEKDPRVGAIVVTGACACCDS